MLVMYVRMLVMYVSDVSNVCGREQASAHVRKATYRRTLLYVLVRTRALTRTPLPRHP